MAGYRLAPKAARARRNPWQRRRRALGASTTQTISVGVATETDTAIGLAYTQTITVGVATEVDSASAAAVSGNGAQGGLAWLFVAAASQTITVGTATETDSARPVGLTADQTITVGVATEVDEARSISLAGGGAGYHWLRRRRDMTDLKKSYFALLQSEARTTAYQSAILDADREAGVMVFVNVTSASGSGGLTVRVNAHDQVSGAAVPLNTAPTAITSTGTYSYAVYPFGAISGNVTQATSAYLPGLFSISVAVGNSTSYTYSLGYCLLP